MLAVRVYGLPAPKGSMRCVGRGGRHQLIPDNRDQAKAWAKRLHGIQAANQQPPIDGPVSVEITFTVPRPATVRRPWPITRSAGDVDKLARLVLDAITDAGVWHDDSQVVELTVRKAYPDTAAPDVLAEPGATIRIWSTEP